MTLKELLSDPAVKGLCIGLCVDGTEWWEGRKYFEAAHAHVQGCRHPGFICVQQSGDLFEGRSKRVSAIVLEELAHLRANAAHNEAWRREMRNLGVPIPAMHRRRR